MIRDFMTINLSIVHSLGAFLALLSPPAQSSVLLTPVELMSTCMCF